MPAKLVAQQKIHIGEPVVLEGASPTPPFATVFEDDGACGYFYALDTSRPDNPIVDALHIYDVEAVVDRDLASLVQIVWTEDDRKAALVINDYPHAVFDFAARRGYCRSGFPPPPEGGWAQPSHEWDEQVVEAFK